MRRKVLSGKDSDRTAKYNLQNKNSEYLLVADFCRRRETHPYSSADTGSKGQNKLPCGQGFGCVFIIVTYFQFLSTPPCRLPHCTSSSIRPFRPKHSSPAYPAAGNAGIGSFRRPYRIKLTAAFFHLRSPFAHFFRPPQSLTFFPKSACGADAGIFRKHFSLFTQKHDEKALLFSVNSQILLTLLLKVTYNRNRDIPIPAAQEIRSLYGNEI